MRRTVAVWTALLTALALTACGTAPKAPSQPLQAAQQAQVKVTTPTVKELSGHLFFIQSPGSGKTLVLNGADLLWSQSNTVARPVRDAATGQAGAFAVCPAQGEASDWTLYDTEGQLLLESGAGRPDSLLGPWALVKGVEDARYEDDPTLPLAQNYWINCRTGQTCWPGCKEILPLQGDEYVLTFLDGRAPVRVDSQLKQLEQYEGYTGAQPAGVPGQVLLTRLEGGLPCAYLSSGLYRGQDGRALPFVRALDDGAGLFLESPQGGGYRVLRLADGAELEVSTDRNYWAYSDTCRLWQDEAGAWHLQTAAGEQTGVAGGVWGGGYYFQKDADTPFQLLDKEGSWQKNLSVTGLQAASLIPLGKQLLAFCYQGGEGGGLRLYRPGGMACALAGAVPNSWQATPDGWQIALYSNGSARLFDENGSGGGRVFEHLAPTDMAGVLIARQGGSCGLMDYNGGWLWRCEEV